jgi:hypothetical protein
VVNAGRRAGVRMPDDRAATIAAFRGAVNMDAAEILDWLETEESRGVGFLRPGESESVGRQSARRIVRILETPESGLDGDDLRHMRKVVGYVRRHLAQQPANIVTSRWRYALMNWGHDPLRD